MELSELRHQIDYIDRELISLVEQRMSVCEEIGKLKKAAGLPVYNGERERAIIDSARSAVPEADRDLIEKLFALLMDASKRRQEEL